VDRGEDCLTVAASGQVNAELVREVFLKLAEITELLGACLLLVDLRQGV
jgi:hypothetical protein